MRHHVENKPQPRLGLAFCVLVIVLNFLTFADAASRPLVAIALGVLALCPVLPWPPLRPRPAPALAEADVMQRTEGQDPDAGAAGVRLRLSTPGV